MPSDQVQYQIDELYGSIERIARFRDKYKIALLGFLHYPAVPVIHPPEARERPHCRSTMRCLHAYEVLGIDKRPLALKNAALRKVLKRAWDNPENTADGILNYYTKTNMLHLASYAGSPYLPEIEQAVIRETEKELIDADGAGPNVYLLQFAQRALPDLIKDTRICEAALGVLRDQLVFHSARLVLEFDSAKLAAAALLASQAVEGGMADNLQLTPDQIEQGIRRAAEIILSSDELSDTMRTPRPQYGEGKAVIHTVPFEDILLISQLPRKYQPLYLPVITAAVDHLIKSFVELPDGNSGWTVESDAYYPKPISWITAIYTELFERCSGLLRYAYTEQYLRKIEKEDPRRVVRFNDNRISRHIANWEGVLETEEESKKLIAERILGGSDRVIIPKNRSLLMFGPPGTSKTTLVKGIAFQLLRQKTLSRVNEAWPVLTVNPADVLRDGGYSELVNSLNRIFHDIRALCEVVVFFDEAESLVFGREQTGESREDRMVTASMLPLLGDIENEDIVLIMATNYVGEIDRAARRRGRFALRVGIGPPNKDSRTKLIRGNIKFLPGREKEELLPQMADLTENLLISEIILLCDQINRERKRRLSKRLITTAVADALEHAELTEEARIAYDIDLALYHDGDLSLLL